MDDATIRAAGNESATSPATGPRDMSAEALQRAVDGQFQLKREIGRGGMGVVYCALDLQLHRDVAIKTLPPHLAADPHVRGRFLREARTAAALSHPNIVPIYSAAERDGVVYFVMGLVDGESLAERIARTGPIPARELVPLLDQLAAALGSAHSMGVVHRDVKAENVLLDRRTDRAIVTDFGIARVNEAQPLTATGTVLGTVHYMSPEQVSGDTVDGRSDLYALGILAFFALTGRFPFERASASAVVIAQVNAAPPRLSERLDGCPPALESMVARLLAKSPRDRFETAEQLQHALRAPDLLSGGNTRRLVEPHHALPLTTPALSGTEAHQVWSRAAELQANTGMITPPANFTPRSSDAPLTQGYDTSLVRASAVDAGIDAKYVDRALLERVAAEPLAIEIGESMQKGPNPFLGSHTKLEYSTAFDGELDEDAFEEVADEVRRALGEMVTVSSIGRTLTINSGVNNNQQGGMSRIIQVHLSSRYGKTTVRAFENFSQVAGGMFAGLGFGLGMAGSALGGGLVAKFTHNPALVIATILAVASTSFLTARFTLKYTANKKERELKALVQRVVTRARQAMLEKQQSRKLPRG